MHDKGPYSRKIKLFLGAYINASNAQNLNCRSIAKNLNKEHFRIKILTSYSGGLNTPLIDGVEYISAFSCLINLKLPSKFNCIII